MSIEFKCSGCGNALRVPDEQAGRQAKCPVCEQLTTIPNSPTPAAEPAATFDEQPDVSQPTPQPTITPTSAASVGSLREHRGVSILVFGIISIFCCGLFGIPAWVMANEDLTLMDRGVMDPAGRGMTMAGKILGIIGLFFLLVGAILPMLLNA